MAITIEPYEDINHTETIDLIACLGHKRVIMVEGEMGIGKSTMLWELGEMFPEHIPCYVDMTTKDLGDLLVPKFVVENGMDVVKFIPNAEFGLQWGKDLIIMWDELTKAHKSVQTQCIRALQERQLGEHKFSEKTIQFATGNTSMEGLLDAFQPHHSNRVDWVKLRKPNDEEWIHNFAVDHNIHPTIMRAVKQFPQMLMSWNEGEPGGWNPYIYDPREPVHKFVTPRSLEMASDLLHLGDHLPHHVKVHALMGMVGKTAAMDIMSVHEIYAQVPKWEDVIADPKKAKMPESAAAKCLFVYGAIQRVEKDTVTPLVTYIQRMNKEGQALFATTAIHTKKADMVTTNQKFYEWAVENHYLFAKNQ